jgi:microcystin-dependent protein
LCDGQTWNGFKTPDLRDRFVVGAGTSYTINQTGGSKDAVVVAHTHTTQPHTHTAVGAYRNLEKVDGSDDSYRASETQVTTSVATVVVNIAGESGTGKNLPPYYALCYIMRVPTS